jgi:hypothetical protein
MDTKATMLQLRLEGVRDAMRRSRLAFFTSAVVSLALFMASWNAHLSWYRRFVLEHDTWSESEVTAHLQKEVAAEWARSRPISIPLLGIQVGSRDAVPLGALTLLIMSCWFFCCVRRHNYVLHNLLLDTREEDDHDLRRMIYHGIADQRLYGDISSLGQPIVRLDGHIELAGAAPTLKKLVQWLPFVPTVMIFLLLLMDILSLWVLQAPLRDPHKPLVNHLKTLGDWAWIGCAWFIAVVSAGASGSLAARMVALERGADAAMSEYLAHIATDKAQ